MHGILFRKLTTMKNKHLSVIALISAASLGIWSCNPLNKMAKKAETVTYNVTPNPLEMHGDSIDVTISGKYPEKFFHKKVTVDVTPTLVWDGGQKEFKTIKLIGEAAEGEGTKISYSGGSFNYHDKIPYVKGMETSELKLKATGAYKTKTKDLADLKIGDGTIITPYLVQNDEKPILGKDKFVKVIPRSISADIHFLINSSVVRPQEMRQDDIKALIEFLKEGVEKEYVWKGVTISAYASPDGELSLNENLANDRAEAAAKALLREFKKLKIEAANNDGFFATSGKGEDWEGFKKLMQESDIQDKDLIIRILSQYTDVEQREKEIKNIAATYVKIAETILPKLRRAQITVNAEEKSKSDEEITALAKSNPDSLTVEELLYAATLTDDMNEKLRIYKEVQRIYPNDWRGHNNVGYIYLLQKNVKDAEAALKKAQQIDPNNAVVNNNLGIVARWNGDRNKAKELYEKAKSAGPEVRYNLGVVYILDGDYSSAVSNMGSEKTFNAALAKLLNADLDGALSTIDASDAANTAMGYYLKAIIGARKGNKELLISNLKTAIEKDASLKEKAKGDAEFIKYRSDADFTGLVG